MQIKTDILAFFDGILLSQDPSLGPNPGQRFRLEDDHVGGYELKYTQHDRVSKLLIQPVDLRRSIDTTLLHVGEHTKQDIKTMLERIIAQLPDQSFAVPICVGLHAVTVLYDASKRPPTLTYVDPNSIPLACSDQTIAEAINTTVDLLFDSFHQTHKLCLSCEIRMLPHPKNCEQLRHELSSDSTWAGLCSINSAEKVSFEVFKYAHQLFGCNKVCDEMIDFIIASGADLAATLVDPTLDDDLLRKYVRGLSELDSERYRKYQSLVIKMSPLVNDRKILATVKLNGYALQLASPSSQNDDQIVLAAYQNKPGSLKFANPDVIVTLLNENKIQQQDVFKFCDTSLVLRCLSNGELSLKFAPDHCPAFYGPAFMTVLREKQNVIPWHFVPDYYKIEFVAKYRLNASDVVGMDLQDAEKEVFLYLISTLSKLQSNPNRDRYVMDLLRSCYANGLRAAHIQDIVLTNELPLSYIETYRDFFKRARTPEEINIFINKTRNMSHSELVEHALTLELEPYDREHLTRDREYAKHIDDKVKLEFATQEVQDSVRPTPTTTDIEMLRLCKVEKEVQLFIYQSQGVVPDANMANSVKLIRSHYDHGLRSEYLLRTLVHMDITENPFADYATFFSQPRQPSEINDFINRVEVLKLQEKCFDFIWEIRVSAFKTNDQKTHDFCNDMIHHVKQSTELASIKNLADTLFKTHSCSNTLNTFKESITKLRPLDEHRPDGCDEDIKPK